MKIADITLLGTPEEWDAIQRKMYQGGNDLGAMQVRMMIDSGRTIIPVEPTPPFIGPIWDEVRKILGPGTEVATNPVAEKLAVQANELERIVRAIIDTRRSSTLPEDTENILLEIQGALNNVGARLDRLVSTMWVSPS